MTGNQGIEIGPVLARIENKVDDIRERVHDMEVSSNETRIKQVVLENEVTTLKQKVEVLSTSADRLRGALYVVGAPGVISALYELSKFLQK